MKCICHFYDAAQKAISESVGEKKISWGTISSHMRETVTNLTSMKFELPRQSDDHFKKFFGKLIEEINSGFRALVEDHQH